MVACRSNQLRIERYLYACQGCRNRAAQLGFLGDLQESILPDPGHLGPGFEVELVMRACPSTCSRLTVALVEMRLGVNPAFTNPPLKAME